MNLPNCPTDPMDVLTDHAVAVIRRYVTRVRANIAEWEPRPMPTNPTDDAPAYGYRRPWLRS